MIGYLQTEPVACQPPSNEDFQLMVLIGPRDRKIFFKQQDEYFVSHLKPSSDPRARAIPQITNPAIDIMGSASWDWQNLEIKTLVDQDNITVRVRYSLPHYFYIRYSDQLEVSYQNFAAGSNISSDDPAIFQTDKELRSYVAKRDSPEQQIFSIKVNRLTESRICLVDELELRFR